MKSIAWTALLVGCLGGRLVAQAPAPATAGTRDSADTNSKLAEDAWNQNTKEGLEQAIRLYVLASDQYRRSRAQDQQAEMLANVAYLHNTLGRSDTALAYYHRLLQLVSSGQTVLRNESITMIGEVYHGRGDLDSALSYYRRALPLTRRTGDRNNEGRALNDIGTAYKAAGRLDSALIYLGHALSIRHALADTLGEGVTLNNMAALLQIIGNPDSALSLLQRSLVLRRATNDRAGEATTLNNMAYSYELLKQNDSSLTYYHQALGILQETGRRATAGITQSNMGRVYLASNQADSARVYLNRGLATSREVNDHIGEGWALTDLGRLSESTDQPDSAVAYLQQALGTLREAGDRAFEGEALAHLGNVWLRRARGQNLGAAVAYFDSAAAVRAEVGREAGADANRLSFAEQDVHLFEDWTLAWLARASEIGADRSARAALAAAERGRAQALLDLIRTTSRNQGSKLGGGRQGEKSPHPPGSDLVAEGTGLASSISRSGSAALSYLITSDTLIVWLILPTGEVLVERQPIGRDSLVALIGTLRSGLGVDFSAASDIAFRGITSLEEPVARVAPRRGLRFAEVAAQALGVLLFPPEMEERVDSAVELVIVPQGPLALIPFSALPLGRSRTALAEPFGSTHPIRYTPSLTALNEAEARISSPFQTADRVTTFAHALIVGNPVMPAVTSFSGTPVKLEPLPSAGDEARWLATRLGTNALTGTAASETTVRRRLPGARLVHLATHGYAFSTPARARQSFVALAPGGGNDGVLSVGEVLDDPTLRLSAELVVLSACQTGLGDLNEAEGTVGLQRAFLAKGARSVLVSLWSVSDAVTDLLMKRFYGHWLADRDHPSKAVALRRAQEEVRSTPGYQHPRFWAAFQLVGAR